MIHRAINIIQSMDNTWLKFVKSQTKSNLQVRHDDQTDQIPKEYHYSFNLKAYIVLKI